LRSACLEPRPGGLAASVLCGIPLTTAPLNAILEEMGRNISGERRNRVVSITNTESMYFALRRTEHAEYVRRADVSACDGIGVAIAGGAFGYRIPRLNGPALMEECCRYGVSRGWRHFFYGGKPGVAGRLAANLGGRFPGLIVAGLHTPPFRTVGTREDAAVLKAMQETRPDILWVGLGLLKQEAWIAAHMPALRVPWFAGVGAAFDFHAGTARRAPPWIQACGLEWLYRLCREPRMLVRNGRSFVFLGQALALAAARGRMTAR